jgi:hypothetical protein
MTKILSSASKIVFIALPITACAGFFLGRLEAKDFMLLASMAYGYYFATKPSQTEIDAGTPIK